MPWQHLLAPGLQRSLVRVESLLQTLGMPTHSEPNIPPEISEI